MASVFSRPRASSSRSAEVRRPAGWSGLYWKGGIDPPRTASTASDAPSPCGLSHSEKFNVSRPLFTSAYTSHEAGATLLYHGHVVRLLWQS